MYAHVKFVNVVHGSSTCNVPVSHINNFDPKNFEKKTTYEVFWSPNEEDSPNSFSPKKQTKEGLPSAGFYKALVLQVAENEEILEEELKKRRVTIATEKCLKSPEIASKSGGEQSKKEFKKRQKISSKKGKLANFNKLCDIKNKHKSNSKTFSLFESDLDSLISDTDDEVIPKKMLKTSQETLSNITLKYKELTKKYDKVKLERDSYRDKYHKLENKLVEYQVLNIKLQNEVISAVQEMKKNSSRPDYQNQSLPPHKPSPPCQTTSSIVEFSSCKRSLPFQSTSPPAKKSKINSKPEEDVTLQSPFKYMIVNTRNEAPVPEGDLNQAKISVENKETDPDEDQVMFSKEKLAAAKLNCKFGMSGDSKYAKNLAAMIWPPHILSCRSVSGRSKKSSNEEKKGLTPTKLEYLRGVFRERLLEENQTWRILKGNLG